MKIEPRHNLFRDRISGHPPKTSPIGRTLVGRWVIDTGGHCVFMNSVSTTEGDFLVPEPSGHWEVLTDAGLRHAGTVARSQTPDDLDKRPPRGQEMISVAYANIYACAKKKTGKTEKFSILALVLTDFVIISRIMKYGINYKKDSIYYQSAQTL